MKDSLVYSFIGINKEEIKIFLPEFEIDKETMKQIEHMAKSEILQNIRIMPDCHKGHGCCVGLTAIIKDKVYPRYVGVDIGCGISMHPLNIKLKRRKLPKIEELIRYTIPMGCGRGGKHKKIQIKDEDWLWLKNKNNSDLAKLKNNITIEYNSYPENMDKDWTINMLKRVGCNTGKDLCSIGTLGSGNHYVEINEDDDNNNYITVHSGSRVIGSKICHYHQEIIDKNCKLNMIDYTMKIKEVRRKHKSRKKVKELETKIREDMMSNLHPKYLEKTEMIDYLVDMIVGQNIATMNRYIMIRNFVENLLGENIFELNNIIETRHNYIDFDRFILRKGSISAENDELCIISLNMKDGILLCKGKGNPDWNYSSAHGCGRLLNRAMASRLNMKQFKKEMEQVYSTCVRKETLDESPMAYKNVDLIKSCLQESVTIIKQLKPVVNCKGF